MQQMSTSQPQRPSGGRLQSLDGGQKAAVGRSAPCRPPWQLIAAQLQDSHTAAGAAHHVSSLAADLCVPRPDGRRPKGLAPRGGSRARHTTSKRCAPASRTRPIARFPARSTPSYARLTLPQPPFRPGRSTGARSNRADGHSCRARCPGEAQSASGGRGGVQGGGRGVARASCAIARRDPFPQLCRVCMRAAAGCPEGGRHRSRPVSPGQVMSPGYANAQESAVAAFRERPWSSVSPRT
jgi:hypothetical protein